VKSLLDVRDDATNIWGVKTHAARVDAFKAAIAKQSNPTKAAEQLADTCHAALDAATAVKQK